MERASENLGKAVLALRPLPEYAAIDLYASATYIQSREAIMSILHAGDHRNDKECVDQNCNTTAKLAMRTSDIIRCTAFHSSLT